MGIRFYGVFSLSFFVVALSCTVAIAGDVRWEPGESNQLIDLVQGGWEKGGNNKLPICLGADDKNQLRPGKYVSGSCNITFGGKERTTEPSALLSGAEGTYSWEAINSPKPRGWLRLKAGQADGKDLFVCRAKHKKNWFQDEGVHPGELFGTECRYGYDGEQQILKDDPFTEFGGLFNSQYSVLYVPPPKLSAHEVSIALSAIKEINSNWRNKNGFLNIYSAGNIELDNENPVLFTAEFYFLLKKLGFLHGSLRENELTKISGAIDSLRLEAGLFDRVPEEQTFNRDTYCVRHFSRDEQIGLLVIDWAFDFELGLSNELYKYGKNNSWRFENRSWRPNNMVGTKICHHNEWLDLHDPSAFLQRQRTPKFIGLLQASVRKEISETSVAEIVGGLKITKDREKQKTSGKILAYLRKTILVGAGSKVVDKSFAQFENAMYDQYGANPMQKLFSIYFQNSDHPIHDLVGLYRN